MKSNEQGQTLPRFHVVPLGAWSIPPYIEILKGDITQLVIMVKKDIDAFVNRKAPDFCLPDAAGRAVCLSEFHGRWVILYFYPRDNTPGCTLEAVTFSAALEEFASLGAQVIGVSGDSPESHQKFAKKHNLTVILLSDTDHSVLKAYDAWKPKVLFGKEMLGTERDTFLIDPAGTITEVWRKVTVKGHVEEVKAALINREKG
jgi:thioredoxin-dependent peroxiredoxin